MVSPSITPTTLPEKSAVAGERTAEEGRRHSRREDWLLSNESILCSQIPISLGIHDKLRSRRTHSIFETIGEEVNPGEWKQK
jgi:hypothetical protein